MEALGILDFGLAVLCTEIEHHCYSSPWWWWWWRSDGDRPPDFSESSYNNPELRHWWVAILPLTIFFPLWLFWGSSTVPSAAHRMPWSLHVRQWVLTPGRKWQQWETTDLTDIIETMGPVCLVVQGFSDLLNISASLSFMTLFQMHQALDLRSYHLQTMQLMKHANSMSSHDTLSVWLPDEAAVRPREILPVDIGVMR